MRRRKKKRRKTRWISAKASHHDEGVARRHRQRAAGGDALDDEEVVEVHPGHSSRGARTGRRRRRSERACHSPERPPDQRTVGRIDERAPDGTACVAARSPGNRNGSKATAYDRSEATTPPGSRSSRRFRRRLVVTLVSNDRLRARCHSHSSSLGLPTPGADGRPRLAISAHDRARHGFHFVATERQPDTSMTPGRGPGSDLFGDQARRGCRRA